MKNLQEILSRIHEIPITSAVEKDVVLKSVGKNLKGKCPFHDDHTPSFQVYPDTNRFYCFGCNAGGDIVEYYMKRKQLSFNDAVLSICSDFSIENSLNEAKPYDLEKYKAHHLLFQFHKSVAVWFAEQLWKLTGKMALEYALIRWDEKIIKDWQIGYSPEDITALKHFVRENGYPDEVLTQSGLISGNEKMYPLLRNRLIFPIKDYLGRIVAFSGRDLSKSANVPKYINSPATEIFQKSNILFGFWEAKPAIHQSGEVYLVEGYPDVLKLHQIGLRNTIGLGGTSLTQGHLEILKKDVHSVTIIGDNDKPGQDSARRSAELLIKEGITVKLISLPQDETKLDPDSFFTSKEQFREYEKSNKKDYILLLGEMHSKSSLMPDEKAKEIKYIASLLSCLPEENHEIYVQELGKILPPRRAWIASLQNASNCIPSKANKSASNFEDVIKKHDFYTLIPNRDGSLKDLKIDRVKLIQLIKAAGYFRYDISSADYRFISIINKTIKEVSIITITDFFEGYVDDLTVCHHPLKSGTISINSSMIKQKLFNGIDSFFSPNLLKRLKPAFEISIKKDTKTEKFFFYLDGFVTITANGYVFKEFSQLDGYVWANQILQRKFNLDKGKEVNNNFYQFMKNISGNDENRLLALKSIIGYAMHSFAEGKRKAIILTDSGSGPDNEPNGRTGKTLLCRGIGQMLNANNESRVYTEVSGKDFRLDNKFRYSSGGLETSIIHINDLSSRFSIEDLFNDITEGVQVDKKNETPFRIQPKIILSTNRTIRIEGESAKDRVNIFEFANVYNSSFSPENEFNQWFFRDWTAEEWNAFDHLMISSVQTYFKYGLMEAREIDLSSRTLKEQTSQEFVNFMNDCINSDYSNNDLLYKIVPGKKVKKQELYEKFVFQCPDYNNGKFTRRKFTQWVRSYAALNKHLYEEVRLNGTDYFIIGNSPASPPPPAQV